MSVIAGRRSQTDRRRAGCIERCKSGSEGGVGRRIQWITRPAPTLQTEGEPIEILTAPEWDREKALNNLAIHEVPFEHMDGNCMGYARRREIAINPINPMPHKTTFHEMAHVLHAHTTENAVSDTETTPRNLREVEAESVALICCESLELPGAEYSRGYIQGWLKDDVIPERSAQKIFHVADQILKAGHVSEAGSVQ